MAILKQQKLFGTVLRTRVLLATSLLEETFPSELTRTLNLKLFPVQRVLDALETEGVLVSRKLGIERRFNLNPRFFAYPELKSLLVRLAEQDRALVAALASRRARPRRRLKSL